MYTADTNGAGWALKGFSGDLCGISPTSILLASLQIERIGERGEQQKILLGCVSSTDFNMEIQKIEQRALANKIFYLFIYILIFYKNI